MNGKFLGNPGEQEGFAQCDEAICLLIVIYGSQAPNLPQRPGDRGPIFLDDYSAKGGSQVPKKQTAGTKKEV